ncbi:MAG: hypothetical protein IPL41_10895 [Micropruina sp.]|nr:hypothetical protein [Micropruina sp.]
MASTSGTPDEHQGRTRGVGPVLAEKHVGAVAANAHETVRGAGAVAMGEIVAETELLPPRQGRVDVGDAKDRNHLSHRLPPCLRCSIHDACRDRSG